MSGDADLYVWSSQAGSSKWVSNRADGNEQVIIPADAVVAGTYQVEVHGLSTAEYRLQVNADPAMVTLLQAAAEVSEFTDATKEQPEEPVVPVDSLPEEDWMGMPPLPAPPMPTNTQTSLLSAARRETVGHNLMHPVDVSQYVCPEYTKQNK